MKNQGAKSAEWDDLEPQSLSDPFSPVRRGEG